MLELSKTVLERVSFDKQLFRKELEKTTKWLKKEELLLLKAWCITTFGAQYMEMITEVFSALPA